MKLLVVNRKDSFLPPGHISAVIDDTRDFTEYEKSCGLWSTVYASELPGRVDKIKFSPDSLTDNGYTRALVFEDGMFNYKSFRINTSGVLFNHPEKAKLDMRRSVIWDYGPGRTYSSPQTAMDALVSLVGSSNFTDTHYIRGWTGTYTANPGLYFDWEVLNVYTVRPNRRHRLIVDAENGETVVWDGIQDTHPLDYCVGLAVGAAGVPEYMHFVDIRDLTINNCSAGFVSGVVTSSYHYDWRIRNLDMSDGSNYIGIVPYRIFGLLVENCFIRIRASSNGFCLGIYSLVNNYNGYWLIKNNVFVGPTVHDYERGIYINGNSIYPILFIINNTFYSLQGAVVGGTGMTGSSKIILAALYNNIIDNCNDCISIQTQQSETGKLDILNTDFNTLNPDDYILNISTGSFLQISNLADWQAYISGDYGSIQDDPLFTDPDGNDFSLRDGSLAKYAGRMFNDPDMLNTARTYRKTSMGAVQISLPTMGVPVQYPRIAYPSVEERE